MTTIVGRDTKTEFESPLGGVTVVNLTTDLRPDALSPDYRVAYTYGPINIGDTTAGMLNRIWYVTATTGSSTSDVILSRAEGAGYSTQSVLFSFDRNVTGTIKEIDLAFSIDGRPVVCAELTNGASSSIALYWYNPIISNFQFSVFDSSGSTPRVLLDEPSGVGTNDILLFYMSGSQNVVRYRQQRDQYATVYSIPLLTSASVSESTYVEDVAKLDDSRLCIYYSRHNSTTARWTLSRLESVLYPFPVVGDFLTSSISIQSGAFSNVSIKYYATGTLNRDAIVFGSESINWYTSSLIAVVKSYYNSASNIETIVFTSESINWYTQSLEQTVVTHSYTDVLLSGSVSLFTSSLLDNVIYYGYPTESITTPTVLLITASLV